MPLLNQLLQLNIEDKIPCMRPKTLEHLKELCSNKQYSSVLEIGTAYGYSSLYLSQLENIKLILTLEKDKHRYTVASKWLNDIQKIKIIETNAFEYEVKDYYDAIIIDGPKSHQDELFEKYSKHLNLNGFIFIDNLNLFSNKKDLTENQMKLKAKVEKFKNYLKNLPSDKWNIIFEEIEDGYCIIYHR